MGAGLGLYNPLAVSYISLLYQGKERANLLGLRASAEAIGQMVLTLLAGFFLQQGWRESFLIYLLAFPLILLFLRGVPDLPRKEQKKERESLPLAVFFLVLLAILLVLDTIAVTVRFSSLATNIMGSSFNSSPYLALMPLCGIGAGLSFGLVYQYLKQATFYLGLGIQILATLLIALSGSSWVLLVLGLILSSIPAAWCFPFLFNSLDQLTSHRTLPLATSLIFVGCNLGNFLAPISLQLFQTLSSSSQLTSPFYGLALLLVLALIASMIFFKKSPSS